MKSRLAVLLPVEVRNQTPMAGVTIGAMLASDGTTAKPTAACALGR
jgi:hypothetical protein